MPRAPCPKYRILLATTFAWLIFFLTYTSPTSHAYAATYPHFIEDFNSDYSEPDKWDVDSPEGCYVTFSEQAIKLEAEPFQGRFPYITANQPLFPEGDSSTEISFRFLNQFVGTGIAITDAGPPPVGTHWLHTHDESIIFAWPLPGSSGIITSLCPETEPECVPNHRIISTSPINPTEWQKVKIDFIEGQYYLYLDETLIFTSASTDRKPRYIWLGSPETQSHGFWTSFEVDYIHIEKLATKATFDSLLEEIKSLIEDKRFKRYLVRFTKKAQRLHKKSGAHHIKAAGIILSKEITLLEKIEDMELIDTKAADWLKFLFQTLIESL